MSHGYSPHSSPEHAGTNAGTCCSTDINKIGHVGLQNLGNTCFMNSGLQVLLSSRTLIEAVLSYKGVKNSTQNGRDKNKDMLNAFMELIDASMNQSMCRVFNPCRIKAAAEGYNRIFRGHGQQDSFELMQTVLDGLEKATNSAPKHKYEEINNFGIGYNEARSLFKAAHERMYNSRITQVTCTEIVKRVRCLQCQTQSFSFSYCQALLLDLPITDKQREGITLSELLDKLSYENAVDDSVDGYRCEKCKKLTKVATRDWISEPAQCLILQLKRFKNDTMSAIASFFYRYAKNNVAIRYPEMLTITCPRYTDEDPDMDSTAYPAADMDADADEATYVAATHIREETESVVSNEKDSTDSGVTSQSAQQKRCKKGSSKSGSRYSSPNITQGHHRQVSRESLCEYKYKFRGASLHSGSLDGGHYTAYAFGCDDKPYHCNDSLVTEKPIDLGDLAEQIYVLIFDRTT